MTTKSATATPVTRSVTRSTLYNVLIGLTTAAVLLQGLWAGLFLEHDGERDAASNWIDVHGRGAEVAIGLAFLATIVAIIKLRRRRDLVIGSAVLTILLVLEGYLGGLIVDESKDNLTVIHIPLAMAITGLAVWLSSTVDVRTTRA
jgi:hypothetical protein